MLTPCQRLSGGRGAEAERIGGAEEEPPTARADTLTHQRHSQRGRGCAEGLRKGRASPTPTGCAQGHAERPQGAQMPQGWRRTPTAYQRLTEGAGAARGTDPPPHRTKTSHRRPGRAAEGARYTYLNMETWHSRRAGNPHGARADGVRRKKVGRI